MLKAAASCVLVSRKASTCKSTSQPCAPLRPCRTATLNILVRKRLYRKGLKSISLDTAEEPTRSVPQSALNAECAALIV